MSTAIETFATAFLLILVILWISHALNGTATVWVRSKFQVFDPSKAPAKSGSGTTAGNGAGTATPPTGVPNT